MANFLNIFSEDKTEEKKAIQLVDTFVADAKILFERSRKLAIETNAEVSLLKTQLQDALKKSRDAHQETIIQGARAIADAEAEIAKFKQLIIAHTSDLAAQTAQIQTSEPT
jgi:ATP-dependent protease HslVU (ClpYQ) peptidase subunit